MARKKHENDVGDWPETETEGVDEAQAEEMEASKLNPEPVKVETNRPKEISVITPAGLQTISTDPTDLDQYEGEYKQLSTGEVFGLKKVENDPHGRTHHLKNVDHFWAGTADEFRQAFEKE
jgi:hypothetical protein